MLTRVIFTPLRLPQDLTDLPLDGDVITAETLFRATQRLGLESDSRKQAADVLQEARRRAKEMVSDAEERASRLMRDACEAQREGWDALAQTTCGAVADIVKTVLEHILLGDSGARVDTYAALAARILREDLHAVAAFNPADAEAARLHPIFGARLEHDQGVVRPDWTAPVAEHSMLILTPHGTITVDAGRFVAMICRDVRHALDASNA